MGRLRSVAQILKALREFAGSRRSSRSGSRFSRVASVGAAQPECGVDHLLDIGHIDHSVVI
jgi:hypothetical protein